MGASSDNKGVDLSESKGKERAYENDPTIASSPEALTVGDALLDMISFAKSCNEDRKDIVVPGGYDPRNPIHFEKLLMISFASAEDMSELRKSWVEYITENQRHMERIKAVVDRIDTNNHSIDKKLARTARQLSKHERRLIRQMADLEAWDHHQKSGAAYEAVLKSHTNCKNDVQDLKVAFQEFSELLKDSKAQLEWFTATWNEAMADSCDPFEGKL